MNSHDKKILETLLKEWGDAKDVIAAANRDEREYRIKYAERMHVIQGAGESMARDSQLRQYKQGIIDAKRTAAIYAESERKVNDCLRMMQKRERNLLYSLYKDNLTIRCAGELMGYSERQTYNIKAEMLEQLQEALRQNAKKPRRKDAENAGKTE